MCDKLETYLFELEMKLQDALRSFDQQHPAGIP